MSNLAWSFCDGLVKLINIREEKREKKRTKKNQLENGSTPWLEPVSRDFLIGFSLFFPPPSSPPCCIYISYTHPRNRNRARLDLIHWSIWKKGCHLHGWFSLLKVPLNHAKIGAQSHCQCKQETDLSLLSRRCQEPDLTPPLTLPRSGSEPAVGPVKIQTLTTAIWSCWLKIVLLGAFSIPV